MNYITPSGNAYNLYLQLLNQNHILIAGATGSGKSVLLNGLIYTGMFKAPSELQYIFIDMKKVELFYLQTDHCILYADNLQAAEYALQTAVNIMHSRYYEMRSQQLKTYNGSDIYIIFDEYADIALSKNKNINNCIGLLATQGRAAKIHLVICTQRPTSDIINPLIKCNSDCKVALRTDSAQESKNIIGVNSAYFLPLFGKSLIRFAGDPAIYSYNIPLMPDTELQARVNYWNLQRSQPIQPKKRRPFNLF